MTTADLSALAVDLCRHAEQVLEVLTSQANVLPELLSAQAHQLVAQRATTMERPAGGSDTDPRHDAHPMSW